MDFLSLLCIIGIVSILTTADSTTRERIELHKQWLERRAALKILDDSNNVTKLSNFNNSIKFNYNHDSPVNTYVLNNVSLPGLVLLTEDNDQDNNSLKSDSNDRSNSAVSPSFVPTTLMENSISTPKPNLVIDKLAAITNMDTKLSSLSDIATNSIETSNLNATENIHNLDNNIIKHRAKYKRPTWSSWTKWTNCSRHCGGGIMSQSRTCITRSGDNSKIRASKDCIGLYKRFRLCNDQNCSNPDIDFREEQCKTYNSRLFRGKQYEWEAYIKDDAQCELNCKPIAMSYFATLSDKVIDGTSCTQPDDYLKRTHIGRAICIEGICKAVHSSGIITGAFLNNGAVRCGLLLCRPVSGIYTKNSSPFGYTHIATIPEGASNISVTELKHSMNLLVLKYADKNFIINGDYSISQSGIYEAAGSLFDYRRIEDLTNDTSPGQRKIEGVTEWLTCIGPITESIQLMVLVQEFNPGIKYEYLLPINSVSINENSVVDDSASSEDNSYEFISAESEQATTELPLAKHTLKSAYFNFLNNSSNTLSLQNNNVIGVKRKRKFLWKVIGFSQCSKSCGGGMQSPIIRCVREAPTRIFTAKRCAHLLKPILNENLMRCNTQPCPAYWKIDEWTGCTCGRSSEDTYNTREIKCVQELGTGMVIQVNVGACLEEPPITKKKCDCPRHKKNHYGHNNNKHKFNNEVNSIKNRAYGLSMSPTTMFANNTFNKRTTQLHESNKKNGVWLVSDWNKQCSTECGDGIQYRSIFCDRSSPNTERCDLRFTPDTTQQCTKTKKCNSGHWFIGPWSACSGDCFNLTKSRSIYCIKNHLIVDESECNTSGLDKPKIFTNCTIDDVKDCRPRWHYSEWTECTKKCDGGTQRRTVKCFEANVEEKHMIDSKSCKYSERPQAFRNCNEHSCNSVTESPMDPRVDLIQNDIAPDCVDEFPSCHLVVKAHLCSYDYYQVHCCHTCQSKSDD